MVARRYGTLHHAQQVESDDFELIDLLATLYDEPFADSSAMPTYRVCQLARRRVTVALSGDGGDESLAGYRRYNLHAREEKVRAMLPHGHAPARCSAPWAGSTRRPTGRRASCAPRPPSKGWRATPPMPIFTASASWATPCARACSVPNCGASLQGYRAVEVLRRHALASPAQDALSQVQYLDLKTYLPGDILTKVDRASMAHALEVRSPLLDHELVEWMSGLPPQLKLRRGTGKYLLKKALRPLLPDELLYRQKMGFSVPLAAWLRGPLRERLRQRLTSPVMAQCGLFDMDYVQPADRATWLVAGATIARRYGRC